MSGSESIDPIQKHLIDLLASRQYPKTLCPSEVARALSQSELARYAAASWRDTMPEIRQRVWQMRDQGEVEIMQRGEVLDDDVSIDDVKGPIRVRRKE